MKVKRSLRYGTRTVYTEKVFTPLPDGGVLVDEYETDHAGENRRSYGSHAMTEREASEVVRVLLNEPEAVGRTPWMVTP